MKETKQISRRNILKTGVASAAIMAAPGILRAQTTPPNIKIGVLQPVTGAYATEGGFGRIGAQLGVDYINKNGGIKALDGAKLEMIFADARSNPEAAVQEVEQFNSKDVCAIIGGYASPLCLAASQAASRYDIPYIVDVGVSDQIMERKLKNTFRFSPGFGTVTKASIDNLVQLNENAGSPAKTVVLIHEDGLFGSGLAKLMQTELPQHGFEIIESISHPTPARDMSNIALRVRSLKPDLIIPSSYFGESVLMMRTFQQQRIKPMGVYCVLNGAASNILFVDDYPKAAENIIDCNHFYDPRKPLAVDLIKQTEALGKGWAYPTPLNFSDVLLLADALERAKSIEKADVIDALASSEFEGHVMPYGPTKFVDGQNTGAAPVVTQVQDKTIRVINPKEFSDAEPVFPVNG